MGNREGEVIGGRMERDLGGGDGIRRYFRQGGEEEI